MEASLSGHLGCMLGGMGIGPHTRRRAASTYQDRLKSGRGLAQMLQMLQMLRKACQTACHILCPSQVCSLLQL